ncbi:MAG TPA: DUF2007 domain-containing protein [Actinomycetota bacterium]|nr:DUF2007 domain-containing protein [Actinomycetota bacterium]
MTAPGPQEGSRGDADWQPLTVAADDIDSHLLAGRLEEEGVPVLFARDVSGYGDYLFGGANPHAPVHIMVPKDRLEQARRVVERVGHPAADDEGGRRDLSSSLGDGFDVPTLAAGKRYPWRWVIAVLLLGLLLLGLFLQSPVIRELTEL